MKKLMIIALAAMVAAGVQAATVGWNIANPGAKYYGSAYQIFVIGQNGVENIAQIQAMLNDGVDVNAYAFGSGKTSIASNGGVNVAPANSGKELGVGTYTSFAVLYDGATPTSGTSKYLLISGIANQTQPVGVSTAQINFQTLNINALASNASNWKDYGAVPEPTTVALLALGLAALGMKRKVA